MWWFLVRGEGALGGERIGELVEANWWYQTGGTGWNRTGGTRPLVEPGWWNRTWWNRALVEPDPWWNRDGGTGPLVEPDLFQLSSAPSTTMTRLFVNTYSDQCCLKSL